MQQYELLYIISSNLGNEDSDGLKKEVEGFIQSKGGVIMKSEKSIPHPLAYPIKHQSSGYFATMDFQLEEAHTKELNDFLSRNAQVLRSMTTVKKPVRIAKEKRVRKSLLTAGKEMVEKLVGHTSKAKEEKGINVEEMDKKLDEMLKE